MKKIETDAFKDIAWKPLAWSVALALAVGSLSALLSAGSMAAYGAIKRPPLAPPGTLFPIVWTILFLLMGFSAYLIWRKPETPRRRTALLVYLGQLAVNFVWPLLFFNAQAYGFAFVWLLLLLWALVVAMIFQFFDLEPVAAYLQLPYLLWLTFAAYLNFGVLLLNA